MHVAIKIICVADALWLTAMLMSCAGVAAGAAAVTGIAPGLHRRLDGAGFVSPHEDDFFADYKDLVTPPKDLLEAPKDLLETPKDLVETPEDLVETPKDLTDTPKDLLDDHQSEDFEEYAKHGSGGAEREDDVDSTHPSEDDTAEHDVRADLSLAKHLKDSDRAPGYGQEEDAPAAKTAYFAELESATGSPYEQADVRSPYEKPAPARASYKQVAPLKSTHTPRVIPARSSGYHGHSAPLRSGYDGNLDHEHVGRIARPEYAYRYGVNDPTTKDVKSAWEQRDGEDTRGGYAVVEPDGHTRVVEYSVTKHGGFNARVKHLPPSGHRGR